ncbi:putative calcium p-type ATPase NCA-3 [Lasiosphaeria ovina]|uniref:Calcium p-type ATPase NCA-3 n=1 Tax=Lasiosphaeria ovina TaxID=92902 RepID=A0AAE0JTI9_9PEZI|nr:putative calcium p-type ATPase NCA-3 [Lasiosphaeria ovina]
MFLVQDNPFAFSPGQLSKLFNPKSHGAFYALGGLGGLEKGLRTDRKAGLSLDEAQLEGAVSFEDAATYGTSQYGELDDKEAELHRNRTPAEPVSTAMGDESFADRKRIFSDNRIPETMHKPILRLAWEVYCSKKSSIVLTLAAVVSFTLGMRRDLLASQVGDKPMQGWAEGAAILVCIAVSVVAGTANQWKTLRLLARLDSYENDRIVKVVRSGKTMEASVFDLLVGDVVCVSAGDIVPVDGILIEGHGLKCDESSCTGESDLLTKVSADQVYTILHDVSNGKKITARLVDRMDPFLISGAKVQEGSGTFLATAVGVNSTDGQIAMAMRRYPEGPAPQTQRIINLSSRASKLGIAMGLMLFVVCLIKFLSTLPQSPLTPEGKSQVFLALLLVSGAVVSLLFVSNIGSPLTAWTLTRMLRDNNLVRDRRAWEKVASVTTICTGKTSILTQNKMSVAAATFGRSMGFGNPRPSLDGANDGALDDGMADSVSEAHAVESLSDETKTILAQSAVVNATAFEGYFDGERAFVGCETEAVLMSFSRDHLAYFDNSSVSRHNVSIVRQVAFSAGTKLMSTTIRLPYGGFRVYVKGGAEIVLALCTRVLNDPASPSLSATGLTGDDSDLLQQRIASYGQRGLRPIALAYRDFSYLPGEDDPSAVLRNMTQLALFGIRDPIRPGITEAVRDCRRAGVAVRIVTGEHIETARWIARETGIWAPDSIALEGPVFRRMDPETQRHVAPRLAVLARASPGDKCVLVRILKEAGEVVAATGGNVDDPPALKIADVGFAKGISGTNAAKTAAPVVLMNDSFCSIVHCIRWGRTFGDAAGKFLQFKLTAATTAAVLTFVLAAASDVNDSIVLGVVQLLWVGMITDFAVLALATDTPTERIMDRKPDRRSSPVFPLRMAKMVLGQSLCHLAISLVLYFGWFGFAGGHRDVSDKTRRNTFVFNTFVWLQIFNKLNSRRLDNRFNVFEGIRNKFFVLVGVLIIGGQVLVMFVGGTAFKIVPLGARDWGVSIGIGALSLPCGALLRLVPDRCVQGPYESVRSLAERLRRAVERRVRLDGTRERGE